MSEKRLESPDDVTLWTVQDVGQWMESKGFGHLVSLFSSHKVDGSVLLMMTENDLRSSPLSMTSLGDIKRLSRQITQLQRENVSFMEEELLHAPPTVSSSGGYLTVPNIRRKKVHRLDSELSTSSDYIDTCDNGDDYSGKYCTALKPEYTKLVISGLYCYGVFLITAMAMAVCHDRVPDMKKYPPLPDIVLDNLPYIPWAFVMCEVTGMVLFGILGIILFFHNHRFIILRRLCCLAGTIFLLRAFTMIITSLSVPGHHLDCKPQPYGDLWAKMTRAVTISKGLGMSIQGVRTCGDYMFSGHTVAVTLLNFFICEYSPRRMHWLHTTTWVMNMFGIFFILAAHEHYSIDVFIAYYITSRLFLYYHTLANNKALMQPDGRRTRIWFPLFSYFESSVQGVIPNEFAWPVDVLYTIAKYLRSKVKVH